MAFLSRLTKPLKGVLEPFRDGATPRLREREIRALQDSMSLVLQSVSNQNAIARENRRLQSATEQRLAALEQRLADLTTALANSGQHDA